MGCTASKRTSSKTTDDWYYEKTEPETSSQCAKKAKKKLSAENVKRSPAESPTPQSPNHREKHSHHEGSNGSQLSMFIDKNTLDLPYMDDEDDVDGDHSHHQNVPPNNSKSHDLYTLDQIDTDSASESSVSSLTTSPSHNNRQYTSPIFRLNRGLTASQADFFRMLDEKIEQGHDYCPDIEC